MNSLFEFVKIIVITLFVIRINSQNLHSFENIQVLNSLPPSFDTNLFLTLQSTQNLSNVLSFKVFDPSSPIPLPSDSSPIILRSGEMSNKFSLSFGIYNVVLKHINPSKSDLSQQESEIIFQQEELEIPSSHQEEQSITILIFKKKTHISSPVQNNHQIKISSPNSITNKKSNDKKTKYEFVPVFKIMTSLSSDSEDVFIPTTDDITTTTSESSTLSPTTSTSTSTSKSTSSSSTSSTSSTGEDEDEGDDDGSYTSAASIAMIIIGSIVISIALMKSVKYCSEKLSNPSGFRALN